MAKEPEKLISRKTDGIMEPQITFKEMSATNTQKLNVSFDLFFIGEELIYIPHGMFQGP